MYVHVDQRNKETRHAAGGRGQRTQTRNGEARPGQDTLRLLRVLSPVPAQRDTG